MCGALQEAHAGGLTHRDLKPSNILVCQRGGRQDVAKRLDFGLVQTHGLNQDGQQLTQEGTIPGTPAPRPEAVGAAAEAQRCGHILVRQAAAVYFEQRRLRRDRRLGYAGYPLRLEQIGERDHL